MTVFRSVLVTVAFMLLAFVPRMAPADEFYAVSSSDLRGPPGSLIRYEGLPQLGLSRGMAYRILYRSTGMKGEPIAVSGLVIAPFRDAPAGGWPVVAWEHGTTGIARDCAPSLLPDPVAGIPGINELVDRNFVVVATDYPGLGVGAMHPFLVGPSEGHAVLDSIRAVRALPEAHAGNRFALWGHSQGGHAALWAGTLHAAYAPELKMVGIAMAAPATELGVLFTDDRDRLSGQILSALLLESWSSPYVYGAPIGEVATRAAVPALKHIGEICTNVVTGDLHDLSLNRQLPETFLKADPIKVEPWAGLTLQNVPPVRPTGVPYYIAQGTADTTVDPSVTVNYVGKLCAGGSVVRLEKFPGKTHDNIAKAAAATVVDWISDRFKGRPPPNTC